MVLQACLVSGYHRPMADDPLVLYKFDACPFCARVLAAAKNLGLDLAMRDTREDPDARAELFAATGRTQVPALKIGERFMFESRDIIRFLEERYSTSR